MWNFKIKNKVDVNKKSGDHIKNSNITVNQAQDSAMLKEIYYKLGGVERDIKNIYHRINELRSDFKNIKNTNLDEREYTTGRRIS